MTQPQPIPQLTEADKEDIFQFLDELRESGDTNMYGARPYIMREYPDLSAALAGELLVEWMRTFEERHPREGS